MSMDASKLGKEITDKVNELDEKGKQSEQVWNKVAEAIVAHIKDNAEIKSIPLQGIVVTPPSTVASQGTTTQSKGMIE